MTDTPELKRTALHDLHVQLGAKMVPFAGFHMPVRYSSDIEEHTTVRHGVGVFDVSHMGEFLVRGPHALALIQWVTSNDASKLVDGKVQYSCLPNEQGGVVDDLLVYRLSAEEYMLVVNASNIEKDWRWIQSQNRFGAELANISDDISLFAVQGPKAPLALQELTTADLPAMEYYSFVRAEFASVPDVIISATGYTGAGGFEIYVPNKYAPQVWRQIFEAGAPLGIKPIGLGARDTLRLEMGYCLYGNDIDDTTSPLEAGLGWITRFSKDFVNARSLRAQKEQGVTRKLIGFTMQARAIPRSHYDIENAHGEVIGRVTSGTHAPSMNVGIGLGYVQTAYSQPDTELFINIRNRSEKAKVTKLPFYKG